MWQPEASEALGRAELSGRLARAFAAYIEESCGEFARLRECRRMGEGEIEIISFDLDIGVPQRPVYDIRETETVSACFSGDDRYAPMIAVARTDFPDTPHQNLVPEGMPCALCVDDRPWQDVRGGYTASEMMGRIVAWFTKACEGELHGLDQPFDPSFLYDGVHEVILTADGEAALAAGTELNIWATDNRARFLIAAAAIPGAKRAGTVGLCVVHAVVYPQNMRRMRRAPANLRQLVEVLRERGTDIVPRLASTARDWIADGNRDDKQRWLLCVIVGIPQVHPSTGEVGATRPMAFLCDASPGRIGVCLGVLSRNDSGEAEGSRYVSLIAAKPVVDGLDVIPVQIAPLHVELDADRASAMAGRDAADRRRVVMVGAGSLGSSLAEHLAREGLFRWAVIDDDSFLPHNVARHTLGRMSLGRAKAPELAGRLVSIRTDTDATSICENLLEPPTDAKAPAAIDEADLVLDASASVPVARWLSDRTGGGRRLCAFFTPDGRSAVLMGESSDRTVNLRDIEAAYLREALVNPTLERHHDPGSRMRYSGACRALTNTIPSSAVAVLSGLIAGAVPVASSGADATLRIWTRHERGIDSLAVPTATARAEVGGWSIAVPATLVAELVTKRAEALPNETGGPLVGLVDSAARHVAIVHALPAPPDSVGSPTGFERGTRGLRRSIAEARARSGGQVDYVGEWHSHPRGMPATPSGVDLQQIRHLSLVLDVDDLPAVSVIVGDGEINFLIGKAV